MLRWVKIIPIWRRSNDDDNYLAPNPGHEPKLDSKKTCARRKFLGLYTPYYIAYENEAEYRASYYELWQNLLQPIYSLTKNLSQNKNNQ